MKHYYLLFIVPLLFGCSSEQLTPINDSEVILSAEVLTYEQLDPLTKAEQFKYGCYCFPCNWNDPKEFEKEKSFYLKIKIDNDLLASLSESRTFPKKDLLETSPTYLYGKYKNRFRLIGIGGRDICETDKFQGFEIMNLERKNKIDFLLIGPIIEEPKKIIIEILDSDNYPGITPKYTIQK